MPLFLLWLIVAGFLEVYEMISNKAACKKPATIYMMPTYTSIETAVNGLSVNFILVSLCDKRRQFFMSASPAK